MSNKHLPYNVADIQRYLQGGMSNSEMRQLELAALNDPFLQDAIDGFREADANYDPVEIEQALHAALTFKPETDENKKEAIVIPIWRKKLLQYAVAASVVLGTGWYIFSLSPQNAKSPASETAVNNTIAISDSVAPKQADKNAPALIVMEPKQVPANTNKFVLTYTNRETGKSQNTVKIPSTLTQNDDIKTTTTVTAKKEEIALNEQDSAADLVETTIPVTAAPEPSKAFAQKPADALQGKVAGVDINSSFNTNLISGKITDMERYPLNNITLRVKGSNKAVVSDERGRFEIAIADSTATLVVSGAGYQSKEFKARANNSKVELQLRPSATSLSELVVTSYANRRKSAEPNEIDTSEASPAGSWKNFETYLLDNKKLKSTGKKTVVVIISFEINKTGIPCEFDIIQSGGVAFDNEAIRLLKAGPAWKNKTTESSAMAEITITF